jgi:hydrogenase-4 component B
MSNEELVLLGAALLGVSGVPGLLLGRNSPAGERLAVLLLGLGSVLGLLGAVAAPFTAPGRYLLLPRLVPQGQFLVAIDGISTVFLIPVFLISLLGGVYGLGYWRQADHPDNGRKLRLFYGLMTAGMVVLLVARHGVLFLIGWEVMALAGFFLVGTEDDRPEVRAAAWIYLVATHCATLCLFAVFALLRQLNGSYILDPVPAGAAPGLVTAVMVLAVVGFGIKAGIMPLHVWLPSAHAMAPSHVSAVLSGVLIKMGIYGIVRVSSLLPDLPAWWGGALLAVGVVSGVLGVAFALGQHDIKRLLAYHSIENIGIIVMGLGLAVLGRALGRGDWVVLGLSGGLLHVWNHGLFKALLFLSAGSVIHATGTRDIDHLGGLSRPMPRTALFFLIGAVAICGLPPLNGFISEFLIYVGLFGTVTEGKDWTQSGAAFAAPALALIGALALACFVKVYTCVFLGTARSEHAEHAHEAGPSMLGPMAVLAGCCFAIGLAPQLVAGLFDRAAAAWAPRLTNRPLLTQAAPLLWVSALAVALVGALLVGALLLRALLRRGPVGSAGTWDCGYAAPTRRIQYTSSSFAETLVGLFSWALRPRVQAPPRLELFPSKTHFHSEVPETVLDEAVVPTFRFAAWCFSWVRWLQRGGVHSYLLYVFLILIVLLLWR